VEEGDRHPVTKVEILTEDHHLVGYVATGGRRFSTWLNLGEASIRSVKNVTLKSLRSLERPEVHLEYALVNRDAIIAAIPHEAPSVSLGGEGERRTMERVDKERHEVVASVPPFAVRGQMHVAKTADIQRAVASFPGILMPITEARLVYTPNPQVLWRGQVVLVNRDKAQLYWPAPEDGRS
jgi:hypothetical protein